MMAHLKIKDVLPFLARWSKLVVRLADKRHVLVEEILEMQACSISYQDAQLLSEDIARTCFSSVVELPLGDLFPLIRLLPSSPSRTSQMSTRLYNAITANELDNYSRLAAVTLYEFARLRNVGEKTVRELLSRMILESLTRADELFQEERTNPEKQTKTWDKDGSSSSSSFLTPQWALVVGKMEKIIAYYAFEKRCHSVSDMLKAMVQDLVKASEIQELEAELGSLPIADFVSRHVPDNYDLEKVMKRLRESLLQREVNLLRTRRLALAEVVTLQEVGARLELSRERIRQIEDRAWRKVQTFVSKSENQIIQRCAARLGEQLGTLAACSALPGMMKVAGIPRALWDNTGFEGALLLALAGPYRESGGFLSRGRQGSVLAQIDKELGNVAKASPFPESDFPVVLSNLGVHPSAHGFVRSAVKRVKVHKGHVVNWQGSLGEKIEALLQFEQRPLSRQEIIDAIGEERSRASVVNALYSTGTIARLSKDEFGLSEWADRSYSGIADEISNIIKREGGYVHLSRLTQEISDKCRVSKNSVKSIASGYRFAIDNKGGVSFTEGHLKKPNRNGDIALNGNCYQFKSGWGLRMQITAQTVRGSGMPMPKVFAAWIGLDPLCEVELNGTYGPIKCTWPNTQPLLGSVGAVVRGLDATETDYLFLVVDTDSRYDVVHISRGSLENSSVEKRTLLEMGITEEIEQGQLLERIRFSVGIEEEGTGWLSVRQRLVDRNEEELAFSVATLMYKGEDTLA